jgi:uncharacterized protein (TIGR02266 family)
VPRVVLKITSAERLRTNYLQDLSEGGLFLKADRILPMGSELTVELWPPGWTDPLALEATVVRVVEPTPGFKGSTGMGVSFHDVAPDAAERLRELIAEHGGPVAEEPPAGSGDDPLEHVAALVHKLEEERAKVAELTTSLIDARGENAAYQEQLSKIERQEGAQRELSERANAEADSLRHRLEEEQEMTRRLQGRVTELEGELQDLRAKETKLRTLLGKAGVGGGAKSPKPSADPVELTKKKATTKGAKPAPAPAEEAFDDPFFELAVEDAEHPQPTSPPPPPAAVVHDSAPTEVEHADALEVAFSDVIADEPIEEPTDGGIATEADLASFLDQGEETLEIADEPQPVAEEPELKSSIFGERLGFDKFSAALKQDTRLMPNERLASRSPASVDEALISQFVNAAPTFSTLLNQVGGSMKEQRLRQLLYELYARALIDIR